LPTWRRMRHHTPNMQHGERGCPGGWWGAEGGGGRLLWVVRAGGCAATVCIQKRGATAAGTGSKNRSRSSWRREFEIRKLLSTNAEYLCECVAVALWVCVCVLRASVWVTAWPWQMKPISWRLLHVACGFVGLRTPSCVSFFEPRTHVLRVLAKYSKCVPLSLPLSVVGFLITHQRVATSRKYYAPTIARTSGKPVIYYSPLAKVGCPRASHLKQSK